MPNNNLITPRMIILNLLDEFMNALKIVPGFNTTWARDFGKADMKIGDTEFLRKPQRFIEKDGAGYQPQPLSDTYATLTIDTHKQISFDWTAFQEVLSIQDQYKRYFEKSVNQLANAADDACASFAERNTNNITGVLGTNPASIADAQALFMNMYALAIENGCPTDDLTVILAPRIAAAVMTYINQMYNPQTAIGRQFEQGVPMANMFGFKRIAVDPNVRRHTNGTFTGTPVVATSSVNGDTSIATSGWTAGDVVSDGTKFWIAATNNVNPKNRRSTAQLKYMVAQGDATADGSGLMTIQLGGGMALYDADQQYANVDVLPVAGAAITITPGTTSPSAKSGSVSVMLGKQGFAFAPIKLPKMAGCNIAETEQDPDTGLSLAIHQGSDIRTYERISRIDAAWGLANLYADNEAGALLGA